MSMEVKVFFRMLLEGRKIRVIKNIEACQIQAISIMDAKFYKETIDNFREQIPKSPEEIRKIKEASEASVLSGVGATNAFRSAFKRG